MINNSTWWTLAANIVNNPVLFNMVLYERGQQWYANRSRVVKRQRLLIISKIWVYHFLLAFPAERSVLHMRLRNFWKFRKEFLLWTNNLVRSSPLLCNNCLSWDYVLTKCQFYWNFESFNFKSITELFWCLWCCGEKERSWKMAPPQLLVCKTNN